MPFGVQPSVDIYMKNMQRSKGGVVDQNGSSVPVKRVSRSYLGSKKAEQLEAMEMANVENLKNKDNGKLNENNSHVGEDNVSLQDKMPSNYKYINLNDDDSDMDEELSKALSPSIKYKNVNGNNYINKNMVQKRSTSLNHIRENLSNIKVLKSGSVKSINPSNPETKNHQGNSQVPPESTLPKLDTQNSPHINTSFIQNTSFKSPTNFFTKSPLSPIMAGTTEVLNISQKSNPENLTNISKIGSPVVFGTNFIEAYQPNPNAEKLMIRGVSYDDYTHPPNENKFIRGFSYDESISNNEKLTKSSIIYDDGNNSIGRFHHYMNNNASMDRDTNSHIIRKSSQKSNISLSKSNVNSIISRSHVSTIDESSIVNENQSAISVENIIPSLKRTNRSNSIKNKTPEVHTVEVSYAIEEIPKDIDFNEELEEDVFMRPSMMRVVEVEPSPILLHEAQTTRISYISNQSSDVQNILNQDLFNSFTKIEEEPSLEIPEVKDETSLEINISKVEEEDKDQLIPHENNESIETNENAELTNTTTPHETPISSHHH